ncbi:MAG: hypothetical protein ACSLFF_07875 [Solirubrobacterales bacterium]
MTPKLPQINFASDELKLEGASTVSQEQIIARPRDEVSAFFSEPRNLERLTPPWLNFEIVEIPEQLNEGALINYCLRLHGITIHWITRTSSKGSRAARLCATSFATGCRREMLEAEFS